MKYELAGIERGVDPDHLQAGDLFATEGNEGREWFLVVTSGTTTRDLRLAGPDPQRVGVLASTQVRAHGVIVMPGPIQIRQRTNPSPSQTSLPGLALAVCEDRVGIRWSEPRTGASGYFDLETGALFDPSFYAIQEAWCASVKADGKLIELFSVNAG